MSVAGRHAAEAGRRTVRRGRRPAAPVGQGEDPVDRPVEAGVFARLDDMLPGIAPGGRGVRRFRGRVRVPQGQGHAPNPRLGEGAPQPRAITCTVQAGENHTIITIDNTTRPPENAADAEDLIQPFHRGDDTRMANRPGHGLGLSIAKACTDAMQATLAVSRPSPGTFRTEIKLPNRPTAPLPAAEGTWTPPSCQAIGIILLIQPRLHLPRDVCGGRN